MGSCFRGGFLKRSPFGQYQYIPIPTCYDKNDVIREGTAGMHLYFCGNEFLEALSTNKIEGRRAQEK